MYSNKWSAAQGLRNHSIFNAKLAKESVMSFTNVGNAKWIAGVMLASASIALMAHAAQADSLEPPKEKVVSFRDLNMHSPEGIEVAFRRIKNAARDVCPTSDRYEMKLRPCINDAVSRAVAQVNSPLLTSLYEAKTGKADKKVTTLVQAH